ncbi:hypothetical protein M426DRAFT_114349 [Hypoxylon sp. CI-4A]|nr:hypothetical protein M426DRAFT_114349 [Hypoxylon sp. CI-4A]
MSLSVEAVVAIVSLFVAAPPTILVLLRCTRQRRYSRVTQQADSDQPHRLQHRQWTARHTTTYVGSYIENEVLMNGGVYLSRAEDLQGGDLVG